MKTKVIYISILLLFTLPVSFLHAQRTRTDANLVGHVTDTQGEHIPFATVSIDGTAIGTSTDETGYYILVNLPEGNWLIQAQSLGYKPQSKEITIIKGKTLEVKFSLEEDALGLDEIVVSANRNETRRIESPVIVNTITPKLFATTQSVSLSEGLNFSPGLRMENNCQNCGFTQVRMNGMEGPYSQILINSRPIFSGLAGVYGLELIPSNMIERIEVVRGGGSALYGSNAIAGTINLILKDPIKNTYEMGINSGLTGLGMDDSGDPASDYNLHFNTSLVSTDAKTGMALYGFYRDRDPFDANEDSFSELASIKNTTVGTRVYHRFGNRTKLSGDFFTIKESRRGGDKHEYPEHMAGIAEAVKHNIISGGLTLDQFFRDIDHFSVYLSGQKVERNSYYGAEESLADYGFTEDFSYNLGAQYNAILGNSELTMGVDYTAAWLKDTKLAYPDINNASIDFSDSSILIPVMDNRLIADQQSSTAGVFAQYEFSMGKLKTSIGGRFDNYNITDRANDGSEKTGSVFIPRMTLKYDILSNLQARVSFAQGYRAPQIFDEDLHIETSGARQVTHRNDPDLKQETSNSLSASLDFNHQMGNSVIGFLVEGFYTKLNDAFTNEFGDPDEYGRVVYTRINAESGALVQGMNMEANFVPSKKICLKGGFTFQKSEYEDVQEFNTKAFFRTPNKYGYFSFDWKPTEKIGFSATGNYTGEMNIPYFGMNIPDPDAGELRTSDPFFELGLKVRYQVRLNGASVQMFAGVKNLFNSYQNDFDRGIGRDPGYIYGPMTPRTIYAGLKFGNFLQ